MSGGWCLYSAALLVASASAEVIFSRRVYVASGRSYQQIWTWNPLTGALKQLTQSARDHLRPVCESDRITFTSPDPDVPGNNEDVRLWSLNRATGAESIIGPVPEITEPPPAAPSDCGRTAKSGALEACGNDETLTIFDSGKQIGRFQIETDTCSIDDHGTIGKCETPIFTLASSDDSKWLLVGEQGLNDGSGQRQEDYYVVRIATMKLSPVASAETAFWLPGLDRLVYQTPQDLARLPGPGRHSVWIQHLMSFDPETGKATAITTGLSNNLYPTWCNIPAPRP